MSLIRSVASLATFFALNLAHALESAPYTAQALTAAQQAGKPVALHFQAAWCTTCRVQERAFNDFKSDAALPITILAADYDKEREFRQKLGVQMQSALIVYRGSKERAWVVAETDPVKLRAALQSAL